MKKGNYPLTTILQLRHPSASWDLRQAGLDPSLRWDNETVDIDGICCKGIITKFKNENNKDFRKSIATKNHLYNFKIIFNNQQDTI